MSTVVGISKTVFAIGCVVSLVAGLFIGAFALAPFFTRTEREVLVIMGSTTVLPIMEDCAQKFMELHPNTDIRVSGGGSGVGIANIIDGVCDIAMASREPTEEEYQAAAEAGVDMVLHPIALDAVCVIVHPCVENALGEPLKLKIEEVREIFTGRLTYWDQVDPRLPHEPITVFIREPGSGTRGTFEEHVLREGDICVGHEKHGNPAMRDAVATTEWSIGYVGLGFVTENVRAVWIYNDDLGTYVQPGVDTVKNGTYPLSRKLYLITNGTPEEGSLIDRFIDFVLSPEGQQIVEQKGFIPLTD